MSEDSNFKEGLKGTTLFGGVSIINILISIIKSKVVAVLLGPAGMGVLGLFHSSIDVVNKSTNFSLRTSAIKNVSEAYSINDTQTLTRTYSVFRRLILCTGFIGLLLFSLLSPYFSYNSFGDYSYTVSLIFLSLSLPLIQVFDGQNVLMQATRHLKSLAKSNILGNILSLVIAIPLYYIWGISSIAYTILLGYLVHYLVACYYTRNIKVPQIKVSIREAFAEGKGMLKMGFFISLQGIFVSLSAYIIRAYLSSTTGVEEVGLYTAGFYIINTYTGLVFNAMSTEYYPRIASFSNNNEAITKAVNSQFELSLVLLAPLVCIFIMMGSVVINLLYSDKFLSITMMINISMIGMFFKAPSWCLGFVYLAKGNSKYYFWNELFAIIVNFALNIVFYRIWGLNGMGVAFTLSFFLYWIQQWIICNYLYNYNVDKRLFRFIIPQLLFAFLCLMCTMSNHLVLHYGIGIIVCLLSLFLSYNVLKAKIDFASIIKRIKLRKF